MLGPFTNVPGVLQSSLRIRLLRTITNVRGAISSDLRLQKVGA